MSGREAAKTPPPTPTETTDATPLPFVRPSCEAITKAGLPCSAPPLTGERFCYVHHPDRAAQRHATQVLGGKWRRPRPPRKKMTAVQLESAEDVRQLVADTVQRLANAEIDRASANAIFYAGQVALRAIDTRDLQRRLDALEAKLAGAQKGRR